MHGYINICLIRCQSVNMNLSNRVYGKWISSEAKSECEVLTIVTRKFPFGVNWQHTHNVSMASVSSFKSYWNAFVNLRCVTVVNLGEQIEEDSNTDEHTRQAGRMRRNLLNAMIGIRLSSWQQDGSLNSQTNPKGHDWWAGQEHATGQNTGKENRNRYRWQDAIWEKLTISPRAGGDGLA